MSGPPCTPSPRSFAMRNAGPVATPHNLAGVTLPTSGCCAVSVRRGPCGEIIGSYRDVKEEHVVMNGMQLKGVYIRWLFKPGESEARGFAMRVFRVEPGAVIPAHKHPWEHGIFVLRGNMVVRVGKARYVVSSGHFMLIPPNIEHEYVNIGDEDAEFICIIPASATVSEDYNPCEKS